MRLCEHEQAADAAIEPVDDEGLALAAGVAEVVGDAIDEGAGLAVVGGDGEHAGRLVDDDQVLVFVDDGEGRIGPGLFLLAIPLGGVVANVDAIARLDGRGGMVAGLAVDGDAAVVEQAAHAAVGQAREGADDLAGGAGLLGGDVGGFGGEGHGAVMARRGQNSRFSAAADLRSEPTNLRRLLGVSVS